MKISFASTILLCSLSVCVGCNQSTTSGPKAGTTSTTKAGAKRLSLMAAKDQTIKRGETDNVLVTINRDNFNEPVNIRVTGLPKGVTVDSPKDPIIAANDNTMTIVLRAGADAATGEHTVTLNAEARDMEKNAQTFRLTVKE